MYTLYSANNKKNRNKYQDREISKNADLNTKLIENNI